MKNVFVIIIMIITRQRILINEEDERKVLVCKERDIEHLWDK